MTQFIVMSYSTEDIPNGVFELETVFFESTEDDVNDDLVTEIIDKQFCVLFEEWADEDSINIKNGKAEITINYQTDDCEETYVINILKLK